MGRCQPNRGGCFPSRRLADMDRTRTSKRAGSKWRRGHSMGNVGATHPPALFSGPLCDGLSGPQSTRTQRELAWGNLRRSYVPVLGRCHLLRQCTSWCLNVPIWKKRNGRVSAFGTRATVLERRQSRRSCHWHATWTVMGARGDNPLASIPFASPAPFPSAFIPLEPSRGGRWGGF